MKTNWLFGVIGCLLLAGIGGLFYWLWSLTGSLDERPRQSDLTAQLMKRKTAAAVRIRDAVAAGDPRAVSDSVKQLRRISEASQWFLKDQKYAAFSDDFRQSLEQLEDAVIDGQIEQLQDAQHNLAESCIRCHQQVIGSPLDSGTLKLSDDRAVEPVEQTALPDES